MKLARYRGLTLVGAVRGPVSEAQAVLRVLEEGDPLRILLDLSPEELEGLTKYFVDSRSEPIVPLVRSEMALAEALSAFGEVRMPSPAFVGAVRWARERGREILSMDMSDDSYADLFLRHVGYLELIRRTRAERELMKGHCPEAQTVEDMATRWNDRLHSGRGSIRLLRERADLTLKRLSEMAPLDSDPPVLAIVDLERWNDISRLLENERQASH